MYRYIFWLASPTFFASLHFVCATDHCQVVGRVSQRLTLGPNNYITVMAGTDSKTPLGKLFDNQDALLNEDRQLLAASALVSACFHVELPSGSSYQTPLSCLLRIWRG
jgi:hypothetical protein